MNDLTYYECLFIVMWAYISGGIAVATSNYFCIIIIAIPFFVSISKKKKGDLK